MKNIDYELWLDIPGIVYDKTLDRLSKVDFTSYYISKLLGKEFEKY